MSTCCKPISVTLAIVAALLAGSGLTHACWVTMLQECFEQPETQWPWFNPAGSGRRWTNCVIVNGQTICYPNIPNQYLRWGVQDDYFNNAICPPDHDSQSCWVIGQPRTQDPEFDQYPPNLDTYMVFGPLDLRGKTAGRVTFYLLNRSEEAHDSVYWGASNSISLTTTNMQLGGWRSGDPPIEEYELIQFDLADLENFTTRDSVSMLDSAAVWVFWKFKADNNANPLYYGSFVDEVVIRLDDGCLDLDANEAIIYRQNGRLLTGDPAIGDTLYAVCDFLTCDGAVDATYPAFSVLATLGEDTLLDQRIQGADRNQRYVFTTESWIVESPGDFNVRFKVDSLNEVEECNENNNAANDQFHVDPPNPAPQFVWLAPATDSLLICTSGYLRWSCIDPDETALISIHYDLDNFGCEGIAVPGGTFVEEHDGVDSLLWDISAWPEERISFVFARVIDAVHDTCIYAFSPVVKRCLGTETPHDAIPREYYLAQNFPNPFNPQTEIRYGIAQGGWVTLRVFDITGRAVRTLVNRDLSPGHYQASLAVPELSSGLYFYTLSTPEGTRTQKMMLLK